MKQLFKMLLLIGLLLFSLGSAVLAESTRDIIIKKVYESFELDKSIYTIEILTDEIKSKNLSYSQISVKPLYQTTPIGRFAIILKVTRAEAKVQEETIRLYIRKYAEVLVAGERIKRFDNITLAKVSIERKEITTLREDPLISLNSVTNMRARRNIAKNRILTKADIEKKPVIKSYSNVHIIYVNGLCRITAEGKALEDGQTGELIRVKNKSSGKIVSARVVDKNLVQVDPKNRTEVS